MKKVLSTNLLSAVILILLVSLSWLYLTQASHYLRGDYKTFYHSLRQQRQVYQVYHYLKLATPPKLKTKLTPVRVQIASAINLNTPSMNMLLKALVNYSSKLSTNTLLWTLLSLLGAALSLALLMKFNSPPSSLRYFIPCLLIFWASWPSLSNQLYGQVTYFLLPLLTIGFLLGLLDQWILMAVVLGFLASLKLFFLLFLFLFLARSKWRPAFYFLLSFVLFSFLPLLVLPAQEYQHFIQLVSDPLITEKRAAMSLNGSLLGFIAALSRLSTLHLSWFFIRLITAIASVATIALLTLCLRNFAKKKIPFAFELSFSFITLFCLLLSPLGWVYYFPLLLIPCFTFYRIAKRFKLPRLFFTCFLLALLFPCFSWSAVTGPLTSNLKALAAFISLFFWFASLLLVTQAVHQKKPPQKKDCLSFFTCLFFSLLFSLFLLSIGFAFANYFNPQKSLKTFQQKPFYWVAKSNTISHQQANSPHNKAKELP